MGKICGEDAVQGKGGKKRKREESSREKDKGERKEERVQWAAEGRSSTVA